MVRSDFYVNDWKEKVQQSMKGCKKSRSDREKLMKEKIRMKFLVNYPFQDISIFTSLKITMNSLRKQSTSNCYITRKNCKIANLLGFKWAQKSTERAIILGSSRKVISIMYLKYPRLLLIVLFLCEECKAWSMINQTILSSVCWRGCLESQ